MLERPQPDHNRREQQRGKSFPMATWQPNPHHADYQDDLLMTDDGRCIGRVEDFGYAAYPCAINAATGHWERGGAYADRVAAMQWAERVAGEHPAKPGDERPPFYYTRGLRGAGRARPPAIPS